MLDSQGITLNYTARIFQTSENLNQLSLISQQWTVNSSIRRLSSTLEPSKACCKRCATAVLSWLDCSSTAARH